MKRLPVIAVLFLTGCGPMTPTIDGNAVAIVVSQVQSFTVKICSFLPTDGSIVEIIKATQGGETAYAIASAICQRVTASSSTATPGASLFAAEKKECPIVAGVCVEGQFVDPKEYEKMQEDPIPDAEEGAPAPAPEPTPPPAGGQ